MEDPVEAKLDFFYNLSCMSHQKSYVYYDDALLGFQVFSCSWLPFEK